MAPNQLVDDGFGHITGPHHLLAKLKEVADVTRRLKKVGIDLGKYTFTIKAVYSDEKYSRPFGFDFICQNSEGLLSEVSKLSHRKLAMRFDDFEKKPDPTFNEDSGEDAGGAFSKLVTHGRGFRQIGTGPVLHVEIDTNTNECNVHVDSHGYVVGPGNYDWIKSGGHGLWDLGSHYVPGLYPQVGNGIRVGPLLAPLRGPDGQRHWIIGVQGEF
jgi:hypothetical protein